MNEFKCQDCDNFIQHYGLGERRLFKLYCGHCKLPGCRKKRPDRNACEKYIPAAAGSEPFATKEYLSKELLQYILKMELLPEIIDCAEPSGTKKRGG